MRCKCCEALICDRCGYVMTNSYSWSDCTEEYTCYKCDRKYYTYYAGKPNYKYGSIQKLWFVLMKYWNEVIE